MKAINFAFANIKFTRPEGMTEEECGDLVAFRSTPGDESHPYVLTAWKPSEEDLKNLNEGLPLWMKTGGSGFVPTALFTVSNNEEKKELSNVIPNGNYFKEDGYLYDKVTGKMVLDGRDLVPIYKAEFDVLGLANFGKLSKIEQWKLLINHPKKELITFTISRRGGIFINFKVDGQERAIGLEDQAEDNEAVRNLIKAMGYEIVADLIHWRRQL